MRVGGVTFESDLGKRFVYRDLIYPESGGLIPSFGGIGTFVLAGNAQSGVPTFTTTMYMPTELKNFVARAIWL